MFQGVTIQHAALIQLHRKYYVQKLELFDSAATGQFDPDRSDLDFLATFEAIPQAGSFNC